MLPVGEIFYRLELKRPDGEKVNFPEVKTLNFIRMFS